MINNHFMPKMDEVDFNFLKNFSFKHVGIVLNKHKKSFLDLRISKRITQLHLLNFSSYFKLLETDNSEEKWFINLITNKSTDFFREEHHFNFLQNEILPLLHKSKNRIRIWSAGCSTGEEAYSIAIILDETGFDSEKDDIKILATDINTTSLSIAESGIYHQNKLVRINKSRIDKYFSLSENSKSELYQVTSKIKNYISFHRLNLINSWPMHGPFDVIFFRNVSIYLDNKFNQQILHKMTHLLSPGGFLIIGHSEYLGDVRPYYELIGNSIYRKIGNVGPL